MPSENTRNMRPLAWLYDTFVAVTMEQAKTPGSIPGRYTLLEEVGQGGMAVVYRAHDETLKREVAIKVLHPHLAADVESKARLEREAQAVAKLRHENILEIFDYSGTDSASSYIVTEFIDGVTLKQLLGTRPFAYPEIPALIAAEVGGALSHAHAVGIIHRDIKPENVMFRKDGLLKLMDFGIAQVVDLQRMTVTGQLLGSPAYMAPELIEGKPLDFRTDVFSVGILLYQLATGSLPFTGKNPHEVLRRITEGRFPDPRSLNRRLTDALARIIARALARRPEDRYGDVGQMVEDLREVLGDAGLTDVRSELRDYFVSPDEYEAALPARLATALTAAAERQLAAGKSAKAIELWSRVLVFDPQNAAVSVALRRLEGRTRRRAAALALGGSALLAVAGWSLSRLGTPAPAPRPPAGPTAALSPVARATPPAAPAAMPVAAPRVPPLPLAPPHKGEADRRASAPAPRGPRAAERGAPAAAARDTTAAAGPSAPVMTTRTFTLGPTPQNVDVYLDGERQFAYDTDHQSITVPWTGDHVIEFRSRASCCFVERVEIGPDHPLPADGIIARRLKWRPAHLQITTEPKTTEGVRIMVRDPNRGGAATSARAGEEVDVPFFPEDEASKEVEVAVDTGDMFSSERIQVRAGQRLAHVVKLKTNTDR
jgi:eukaryotic-like serine/threonine-protein kinase